MSETNVNAQIWLKSHAEYNAATGCWLWSGAKYKNGYGHVKLPRSRKTTGAHRRSWMEFYGPIPEGMYVCHKCDVRLCINPDHLFLGTAKDNLQDCSAKGRIWHGESRSKRISGEMNSNRVLGWSDVFSIRRDYAGKQTTYRELSRRYGVSESNIGCIIRSETWCS